MGITRIYEVRMAFVTHHHPREICGRTPIFFRGLLERDACLNNVAETLFSFFGFRCVKSQRAAGSCVCVCLFSTTGREAGARLVRRDRLFFGGLPKRQKSCRERYESKLSVSSFSCQKRDPLGALSDLYEFPPLCVSAKGGGPKTTRGLRVATHRRARARVGVPSSADFSISFIFIQGKKSHKI